MKLPREFDEKLRKLLAKIERPLLFVRVNTEGEEEDGAIYADTIYATHLRDEILVMLDFPPYKGKYRQLDIEEEIKNENY